MYKNVKRVTNNSIIFRNLVATTYINSLYILEFYSLQHEYRYYPFFNSIKPSVAFHIETNHLPGIANQMIGFYMKRNTGLKWITPLTIILTFSTVFNMLHVYAPSICLLRVPLSSTCFLIVFLVSLITSTFSYF